MKFLIPLISVCLANGDCMWPLGPEYEQQQPSSQQPSPQQPYDSMSIEFVSVLQPGPFVSGTYIVVSQPTTCESSSIDNMSSSTTSCSQAQTVTPCPCVQPTGTASSSTIVPCTCTGNVQTGKIMWPTPEVNAPLLYPPPPCVNLTSPAYSNITTVFRLAPRQQDYWQAQQFCLSRFDGDYAYVPVGCTDCFPTVILRCPDMVFMACKEGFIATSAGCVAMVDLLPSSVWNYGPPRAIVIGSKRGFAVLVGPGQEEIFLPKRCRGPMPLAMEKCWKEMAAANATTTTTITRTTSTMTVNPTDLTGDYYSDTWSIYLPTPTGTTMCDVF